MPTVFVYEFCCAIGSPGPLLREGRAMRDAVADDFRRLPGVEVVTLDDAGDAEPDRFLERLASSDSTLVIAPETDGVLADRCRWVREFRRPCLNSSAAAIAVTADKLELCRVWMNAGVPTPMASGARDWPPYHPAVWKPRFGAGSAATMLLRTRADEERFWESVGSNWDDFETELMVQDFVPGRAASVAFLIGPGQTVPLLPTFQHLSDDGRFTYLGGELPIPPDLAERAVTLGRKAVECVPGLRGYVGVDLVLGDAGDFAIEINPRLTTSYVGLRALAETNLAGAMLDVCAGRPVDLRWKPGRVRFTPDGAVSTDSGGIHRGVAAGST